MAYTQVYVEREPFLIMLAAAVETFKRECTGDLILKRSRKRNMYVVTRAHPCQLTKKRTGFEVTPAPSGVSRLQELSEVLPRLFNFQASFHSHPIYINEDFIEHLTLSPTDRTMLHEARGNKFTIIIVISQKGRAKVPWEAFTNGTIQGTLGRYRFGIGAFAVDKDGNQVDLKLLAPAAIKALNRAQR